MKPWSPSAAREALLAIAYEREHESNAVAFRLRRIARGTCEREPLLKAVAAICGQAERVRFEVEG